MARDDENGKTESGSERSVPEHEPPIEGGELLPQRQSGGYPVTTGQVDLSQEEIIAVIAALIPGLGQLLLGQTVKGLVILGIALLSCAGMGLLSVASVLDAYLVARAKHRRAVGEWEFFPDFQEAFDL